MRTRWQLVGLSALVALVFVLGGGTTSAQEPAPAGETTAEPPAPPDTPAFAVQPSGPDGPSGRDYFTYRLEPGEVFGDTVAVSNLGDAPVRFALYATDATTAEGAAFALLREEDEPIDVGTWIRLAAEEYEVPAGTRIDVPFSLTVPADASPGDHVGAIVAQPLIGSAAANEDPVNLDIRLRIGARVYVRVDGPARPDLRIERLVFDHDQSLGPTSGNANVEYVIRNTGNLVLLPTARLRITGPFGITVSTLDERQLPELLPGAEITIAETAEDLPLFGRLDARLEVTAEGVETNASTGSWAVPWLVVFALAIVGAAFLFVRWRRARAGRAVATE
jgi:WxL Interacting Protein, peptidoglycan binding domain